jgi:hypothetical protein
VIFFLYHSGYSAKITHISAVIRAACGAVISDHPYNADYVRLGEQVFAGDMRAIRGMCGRLVRVFAIDLNPELVRTGRAPEEVQRSRTGQATSPGASSGARLGRQHAHRRAVVQKSLGDAGG